MAFRLKKTESVQQGVRRLYAECLERALKDLRGGGRENSVHIVRKEIKKLRAVLRLVRGEIGDSVYGKSMKALKEAAGLLAIPRDAEVKLRAFEELVRRCKSDEAEREFAEVKKVLMAACAKETKAFWRGDAVRAVKGILRGLQRCEDKLKVNSHGWSALRPGLKRSYRLGRQAYQAAMAEASVENLHEWRKQAKELWYCFRLLSPIWPHAQRVTVRQLEALGETLGNDRDLALLEEVIVGAELGDTEDLETLIAGRKGALQAAAFQSGARLYAEKPAAFCEGVEGYWRAWRAD